MATFNHLKNRESQRKVLTVAFGRHIAEGHLLWSRVEGSSPTHQVYGFNRLGEGKWNAVEGVWWRGFNLASSEYHFRQGGQATSMSEVDSWFPLDVPHSNSAALAFRTPAGEADIDNVNNPPEGLSVIAQTKQVPNFNNSGTQTDFSYSANPAREVIELLNVYARLPNLPSVYANLAAYWKSRIDWAAWKDWHDYLQGNETVDYTTIADFEGFGLTAEYFNNDSLTAPVHTKRVETYLDLQFATGSPAPGINADSFSSRLEGKIRAKYSETYTFSLYHDDGGKLWVNGSLIIDQWGTAGTHTGTIALTAGQLYDIKIEHFENTGNAGLTLKWSSTSQPEQIVPAKYLYPKAESRPRYESHVFFATPTNIGDAIRQILFLSNSVMQDVNGKIRFFCLEQLSSSFTFDSSNIIEGSFSFKRRDILQSDPITEYEAKFRDLDSQYLEEPAVPVSYKIDWLTRKYRENVKVVELFNMTRWQARKVLQTRAKLEVGNDLLCEFSGYGARSYQVVPGDMVTLDHRKIGGSPRTYLVREAVDSAVAEAKYLKGAEIEKRKFKVQEWS